MDHVKFAIDMSSTVILVGYPELDMPVEWYCDGTEYKNYLDFMRKHGYTLCPTGRFSLKPENAEKETQKDRDLQKLIDEKAVGPIRDWKKLHSTHSN